jgi:hypothetical protein
MSSDIEIANNVLIRLGQQTITQFGENPGTGLLLKSTYETSRDALLRTIPWNFARRWANLAQLVAAPLSLNFAPNSGSPGGIVFTGAYQLPQDFIRLYRFSPSSAHWRLIGQQIYTDAVPANVIGQLLGLQPLGSDGPDNQPSTPTNPSTSTVGIEYIYRVTDPTLFDPMFTDLFTWKLIKELSFGITGLLEMFRIAEQEYKGQLADAAAVNGMENVPDEFFNTDLTDVRYGYSSLGTSGGF